MAEAPRIPTLKRNSDPHKIRAYLSLLIVIGFFAVLLLLLIGPQEVQESSAAWMMLGALSTTLTQTIQWYFGSSSGSERKSDLLAQSEPAKETDHAPKPV